MHSFLKSRTFALLTIGALSLLVAWPAFHPNLFNSHESVSLPIRIFEMAQAMRDGHFPVRWLPDIPHLYGYPFFNFYAPFAYYLGAFIYLAGVDLLLSLQLVIFTGFLVSGLGMYFFVNDQYGPEAGLISAVSYLFVPYHLVDIYVRGALAEFFCFALLPLVLLFLGRFMKAGGRGTFALAALSYGVLVMTHNITALFASLLCVVYIAYLFVETRHGNRAFLSLLILALGLGVSAFYWLPAVAEMKFTNVAHFRGGYLDLGNHFVYPHQLFDQTFGFGGSYKGPDDGMSFQLGAVQSVLFLLAFPVLFKNKLARAPQKRMLIFFIALTAVTVFLMMPWSSPFWRLLPLARYIQFPWRLLIFAAFFMSVISGAALYAWVKEDRSSILFIAVAALMVVMPFAWAVPGISHTFQDGEGNPYRVVSSDIGRETLAKEFGLMHTIGTTYGEYMPSGMTFDVMMALMRRTGKRIASVDGRPVEGAGKTTGSVTFDLDRPAASDVLVDIIYFPGWTVYMDGKKTDFTLNNFLMSVKVPPGKHSVAVVFENTPVRAWANGISLLSFFIVALLGLSSRKSSYGHNA